MKKILYFLQLIIITLSISPLQKTGKELIRVCANGLLNSVPPLWCWKKDGDAGKIPTDCPPGWFRSLALCYEYCKDNYRHIAGVCYKNCEPGYKDHGLSCFKDLFHWYFKSSYIPKSMTNFDKRVPCPGQMYHEGALCYRNCNIIGLANCGIGACSINSKTCTDTIIEMIIDVFKGFAKLFTFVENLGLLAIQESDKTLINNGLVKLGANHLKMTYGMLREVMNKGREYIYKKAFERAQNLIDKNEILKDFGYKASEACIPVNEMFEKYLKSIENLPKNDEIINSVDIFDGLDIPTGCDSGDVFDCLKDLLSLFKEKDPSGLLTIGMAFMYPICDVPEKVNLEKLNSDFYDNDCIYFYEDENFKGEKIEICNSLNLIDNYVNFPVMSIKSGTESTFVFFENENFQGKHFIFGKSSFAENVENYLGEDYQIKSIMKVDLESLYVYYSVNGIWNIVNFKGEKNVDFDVDNMDNLSFEIYSSNFKISLFGDGNVFSFEESLFNVNSEMIGMKKINKIIISIVSE